MQFAGGWLTPNTYQAAYKEIAIPADGLHHLLCLLACLAELTQACLPLLEESLLPIFKSTGLSHDLKLLLHMLLVAQAAADAISVLPNHFSPQQLYHNCHFSLQAAADAICHHQQA
jgi:hypothetical protein